MEKPKKKRFEPFGRPTKYKPEYCQAIIDFFNRPPTIQVPDKTTIDNKGKVTILTYKEAANELPMFIDFASIIGVCVDTFTEWKSKYPDFSLAYERARQFYERNWMVCSLKGLYNPQFTIFMGKNVFKWTDKTQVEHGNIEDNDLKVSFVAPQLAEKIEHAEILELPDEIKQIESKPLDETDDTLPDTSKPDRDID